MKFEDVIEKRASIRKFEDKKIKKELIEKILKESFLAPSAGNLQAYFVYVVSDNLLKEKLSIVAYGQHWISKAPVIFVICADVARSASKYGERGKKLYSVQDATILGAYIQLVAVEKGLSSAWVGAFSENDVSKLLNLPKHHRPVAIIPLGYGKGERMTGRDMEKYKYVP